MQDSRMMFMNRPYCHRSCNIPFLTEFHPTVVEKFDTNEEFKQLMVGWLFWGKLSHFLLDWG